MANLIKLSEIKLDQDRQRKEFPESANQELSDSIQRIGLLHPLVLRFENGTPFLVAGERRYRAIQDLYMLGVQFIHDGELIPVGEIPYVNVHTLNKQEQAEIELEENIRRLDLTWAERAAATARLKELREIVTPEAADNKAIAEELYPEITSKAYKQDMVRKDLIIAKHLDDPDIKKAKTADEAFKILQKKEKAKKYEEQAELVGSNFTCSQHTLLNTDCIEWMKQAESGQFDIILTDPPYGMGADEFGDSGGKAAGGHTYRDDLATFFSLMKEFIPASYRLTKSDAHLYCFCDIQNFYYIAKLFAEAGWKVFRTPLIWYKPGAYRAPWPEQGPQRKYEIILYAVKGDMKVTRLAPDVLTHNPDDNMGHMAQKPVELYSDLLSRSARPGMKVLDPFCGSGTIFPAAQANLCYATGLELDSQFYGMGLERLKGLK